MECEVKEIEYCKVQVHYESSPDVVVEKRREALAQLDDVKIPGFRKGKASPDVLKVRFKKNIEEWVKREMLSVAYDDVLFETKMKPIGYPQFLSSHLSGNKFICDLVVMKKPDFDLAEYKEIEIPKPHQPQTVTEIAEAMVQELRIKFGDYQPYEDGNFVENNDRITMDIETYIDGNKIEEACKVGHLYDVGSIPELDSNIFGMVPEDEREFEMKLPETFGPYANQDAKLKVIVHMGMKIIPSPLNDELAQKAGFATYDELHEKAMMAASGKLQSIEQALISSQLTKKLVAAHDFEIPTWLISMETQQIAAKDGIDLAKLTQEEQETYKNTAIDNVKLALILDSIREAEPEADLTDQEAANMVKQQLSQRTQDVENIFTQIQKNGQLVGMIAHLKNQFSLQWLSNKAKIVE